MQKKHLGGVGGDPDDVYKHSYKSCTGCGDRIKALLNAANVVHGTVAEIVKWQTGRTIRRSAKNAVPRRKQRHE